MRITFSQIKSFSRSLLEPKAMIVGLTLFISLSAYVLWAIQHRELELTEWLKYEDHFYPPLYVFALPLAAITLWLNRSWSQLIAVITSGWLIIKLAYLSLLVNAYLIHHDDADFLSNDEYKHLFKQCWREMYIMQSQNILYLFVAILIFVSATVLLLRFLYALRSHINKFNY